MVTFTHDFDVKRVAKDFETSHHSLKTFVHELSERFGKVFGLCIILDYLVLIIDLNVRQTKQKVTHLILDVEKKLL